VTVSESKKRHLREILLYFFNVKKSAVESYRLLVKTALSETTCRDYFRHFKSGDSDMKDKERVGKPKLIEDAELKALLDEDPCQTQKELAESLGVAQ